MNLGHKRDIFCETGDAVKILRDSDSNRFSRDKRLNKLLKSVLSEVKLYAEDQIRNIKQLARIGMALSIEKDLNKLLEMIVSEARHLSNADAGSLYILDKDKARLRFEILQNDSMSRKMAAENHGEITLPDVPLFHDDMPNHANVSSFAALTGEVINIPDVYAAKEFDFTGPKNYDQASGYRSKSMLVIPMKNHESQINGVLQLLNAQDEETGEVIPFSTEVSNLIASLASQAAVALTNTQLVQELKTLFYAFIKSIATAIDAKSPYTGGHIKRVVHLTMAIAEKIAHADRGRFQGVNFNEDELEELHLAAWMHDVGKITTPEYVIDKATKLQTLCDRIDLIDTRFALIGKSIEAKFLREKIALLQNGRPCRPALDELDQRLAAELGQLEKDRTFIHTCNRPGETMTDETVGRIRKIAGRTFETAGAEKPFLTDDEVRNLSVRKGTLTPEERHIIKNHATMTQKILDQLPFPRKLANVPTYAGQHHETLDGSGYPKGLSARDIPLQSRIMAVADIFESLTAKDRPYKDPMTLSQVLKIMDEMKRKNLIDPDVYDLFVQSRLYAEYAEKEMMPGQMDMH